MKKLITIDKSSNLPKYRQIVSSVADAVAAQKLKLGQQIPSINQLCKEFSLSRETALTAYKELKSKGIISSSPGKGYYIASEAVQPDHKIFLLFDEWNGYKEVLYNSFKASLGVDGKVEIYFHHYNSNVFESLVKNNIGSYTAYVVMPIPGEEAEKAIQLLPKEKLFILDVGKEQFAGRYSSVTQDFKKDVYKGLKSGDENIQKYKKLILVFPELIQNPREIIEGFEMYCKQRIDYEIIGSLEKRKLTEGEAYFVIDDKDLVHLVKEAKLKKMRIGHELGILSFNDTPFKEVVADGITTISTDFEKMGNKVVEMILTKTKGSFDNPSRLIRRASL